MVTSNLLLLPQSKERALSIGSIYYFTGKECSNGHLSKRYTSSSNCVQCIADRRGKDQITTNGKPRTSSINIELAAAALSNGETTYIANGICKHGHKLRYCVTHNCVECDKKRQDYWRHDRKWKRIEKEYGLSQSGFNEMVNSQFGRCAICAENLSNSHTHVDHCHTSGKVRGILCNPCNNMIGHAKDNIQALRAAADYLEQNVNGYKGFEN
mgnify:CR=1 FL=1